MVTNYKKAKKEVSPITKELIKLLLFIGCNPLTVIEIFSKWFNATQVRKTVGLHVGIDEKSLLSLQNIKFLRKIREENPKVNL